jgi:hypothetical protein
MEKGVPKKALRSAEVELKLPNKGEPIQAQVQRGLAFGKYATSKETRWGFHNG